MTLGPESTALQATAGLDLSGRTYLVTGANSGLGRETVRVLGLRGAHVVATCRTEESARSTLDALGVTGTALACELGDLDSVAAAANAVDRPLHGIIANAGIMALPTLQKIRGIETQFFTNHVGHAALVTALLPRLSPKGRVVMVSSAALRKAPRCGIDLEDLGCAQGYEPWRAYGQSKLANLLFARALSRRLQPGQSANTVHPGVIDTQLGRHVPDKEALYESMKDRMKTVEQGAATQCWAASHPSLAKETAAYFKDCRRARPPHRLAKDDVLAEALWNHTLSLTSTDTGHPSCH